MASKSLAKEEIFSSITELICRLLSATREGELGNDKKIELSTNIFDDLGIDSVEILDLFSLIEKEFGIVINMDRISSIKLVGEIVDYLSEVTRGS